LRRGVPTFALLALFVALLSSCGDGGAENGWEPCEMTSTEIGHPTGSTDLVVRFGYGGGLPPPIYMPDELPDLLLYGDGRLLVADQTSSWAVPRMLESRLDETQIQRVLHAIEGTCSLERDWRLDAPVYDVGGLFIEVTTDEGTHTTFSVGQDFAEIAQTIPDWQDEQRAALTSLDQDLMAMAEAAGLAPYEPEALGVFFEQMQATPAEGTPTAPWPLKADLATFGQSHPEVVSARCGIVEDGDATAVLAALAPDPAGLVPVLEDAGAFFQLVTRPMLPGETDCLALIA
jgi:hypothetical protein